MDLLILSEAPTLAAREGPQQGNGDRCNLSILKTAVVCKVS
jgi:hypothetical protein